MSEKKANFLEGFKKSDIVKSASMDIKPRLQIESLGIDNSVIVEILSEPYQVDIPKEKAIGESRIWMVDVLHNGVAHQFIAQASSFRYQLGVLVEKHFEGLMANIIGQEVVIWKELVNTKQYGEQALYQVSLRKY